MTDYLAVDYNLCKNKPFWSRLKKLCFMCVCVLFLVFVIVEGEASWFVHTHLCEAWRLGTTNRNKAQNVSRNRILRTEFLSVNAHPSEDGAGISSVLCLAFRRSTRPYISRPQAGYNNKAAL